MIYGPNERKITNPLKSGYTKFIVVDSQQAYEDARRKYPEIENDGIFLDDHTSGLIFAAYNRDAEIKSVTDYERDKGSVLERLRLAKTMSERLGAASGKGYDDSPVPPEKSKSVLYVNTSKYPLGRRNGDPAYVNVINPTSVPAAFWTLHDAPFYHIETTCDIIELSLDNNRSKFPTAIKITQSFPWKNPSERQSKFDFSTFGKRVVLNHNGQISPREWPVYLATSHDVDFIQINFDQNKYIEDLNYAIKNGTAYPDAMIRPFISKKNFINPTEANLSKAKILNNNDIRLNVSGVSVDLEAFEGYSISGQIKDCIIFVSPTMMRDPNNVVNLKNVTFSNCVFVDFRDYISHNELTFEEYLSQYRDISNNAVSNFAQGTTEAYEFAGRTLNNISYMRSGGVVAPFHNCIGSFILDNCFCAISGRVEPVGTIDLDLTMASSIPDYRDCSIQRTNCIIPASAKINYGSIAKGITTKVSRERPIIRFVQDKKTLAQVDFKTGFVGLADEKILEINEYVYPDDAEIHNYQNLANNVKKELIGLLKNCISISTNTQDTQTFQRMLHEVEVWKDVLIDNVVPDRTRTLNGETIVTFGTNTLADEYKEISVDGTKRDIETYINFNHPIRLTKEEYAIKNRDNQKDIYIINGLQALHERGGWSPSDTKAHERLAKEFDAMAGPLPNSPSSKPIEHETAKETAVEENELDEIIYAWEHGEKLDIDF